jgi:hypothetical protein
MTIPEFAIGGQVPGLGGGILAILHPGEFVIRQQAVDALGTNFLAALNRAPQFAAGGPIGAGTPPSGRQINVTQNFTINAMDGADVDRWWRANRGRMVREIRRAIGDGAL